MIRLVAFRVHQYDPLGFLIQAETRGNYTHSALEIDRDTHTIIEAYYPRVRKRQLELSELSGVDYFEIKGLTLEGASKIMDFCNEAIEHQERYSIEDLFRFNPFFRMLLGEAKDTDASMFCSMFAMKAIECSGVTLLNAHSYEVDPYRLTWSTELVKVEP